MTTPSRGELPIIQATTDLIGWFIPLLNRLPKDHRFALGDRLVGGLYDFLEGLVRARYSSVKLPRLESLAANLDLLHITSVPASAVSPQHPSPSESLEGISAGAHEGSRPVPVIGLPIRTCPDCCSLGLTLGAGGLSLSVQAPRHRAPGSSNANAT
jgi:hypothetical protein